MQPDILEHSVLTLIARNTAHLPQDVGAALFRDENQGPADSAGSAALGIIRENCRLAASRTRPLCQDTGYLTFIVTLSAGSDTGMISETIGKAVAEATKQGLLRQNSVDPVTGNNSGNNLGQGTPDIHFEFQTAKEAEIRLLQKGGGCENMTAQYTLPAHIGGRLFGRDLTGVHACVLDAVNRAQGKGCSPGFLGVCIGGDRASGLLEAKNQFFHSLDDPNPVPELADLEQRILRDAGQLEIGPMGFGGRPTIAGCRITARNRIPASYFVSVAYMCWAYRRTGIQLDKTGAIAAWLYDSWAEQNGPAPAFTESRSLLEPVSLPLSAAGVNDLRAGDMIGLSGRIFTGRECRAQISV